jgi:hypothetical protein
MDESIVNVVSRVLFRNHGYACSMMNAELASGDVVSGLFGRQADSSSSEYPVFVLPCHETADIQPARYVNSRKCRNNPVVKQ